MGWADCAGSGRWRLGELQEASNDPASPSGPPRQVTTRAAGLAGHTGVPVDRKVGRSGRDRLGLVGL